MFLSGYNRAQDRLSGRRSIEENNRKNNVELVVLESKSTVKVNETDQLLEPGKVVL